MHLTDTLEHIEKLPKNHKKAILGIIDIKTENDKNNLMLRMRSIEFKLNVITWFIGIGFVIIGVLVAIK